MEKPATKVSMVFANQSLNSLFSLESIQDPELVHFLPSLLLLLWEFVVFCMFYNTQVFYTHNHKQTSHSSKKTERRKQKGKKDLIPPPR
jgi:hypothetical protein